MNEILSQLNRAKTITFDCYGTLIDWKAGLRESLGSLFGIEATRRMDEVFDAYVEEEAAEEAGPFRSYREIVTATALRLARRFGWELPPDRARYLAESLPSWKPFADTNEALKLLKNRFRLGVLSNIDRELFTGTARHFAVPFDFVITAQDVGAYKPNLAHFRRAVETQGPRESLLHVAQSLYHDGAAAAAMNIPFVWINRYGHPNETNVHPAATFPDLKSLALAIG